VGKYYQALERLNTEPEFTAPIGVAPEKSDSRRPETRWALVPSSLPEHIPSAVLQAQALRSISERIAPLAVVETSTRLLVAACNHGDGASTVAGALALDISQRLRLRTLLIDAHLRYPALHLLFKATARPAHPELLDQSLQVRSTGLPNLDLMNFLPQASDPCQDVPDEVEKYSSSYQVVLVDLGVPRLDPRMLALARASDPIVLVVRYGHTDRAHLNTTVSALRAANRSMAGVIINDQTGPTGKFLRRLIPA
jgi:Mrp family chromosome partitioning ATPase